MSAKTQDVHLGKVYSWVSLLIGTALVVGHSIDLDFRYIGGEYSWVLETTGIGAGVGSWIGLGLICFGLVGHNAPAWVGHFLPPYRPLNSPTKDED